MLCTYIAWGHPHLKSWHVRPRPFPREIVLAVGYLLLGSVLPWSGNSFLHAGSSELYHTSFPPDSVGLSQGTRGLSNTEASRRHVFATSISGTRSDDMCRPLPS